MGYGPIFHPGPIKGRLIPLRSVNNTIKNNWTTLLGIGSLLISIVFAFSDNLSELAPVFLVVAVLSIVGTIYRKNRQLKAQPSDHPSKPSNRFLTNSSTVLSILGLLVIGLSAFSFFDSSLTELAPAAIVGGLLLITALLLRIFNGILSKQIDATSGVLSIATISLLVGIIFFMAISAYLIYVILTGLAIL